MKVEIYGSAESQTVRGATVNFNADSAAPVTEFVAEVNQNGFDGRTGVDINNNGTTKSVAFGKTCYGGSANVTTGTLTEEYGGGAYDPQNVPAEVKSEVESKLTLETATPGDIVSFDCELGEYPLNSLSFPLAPIQDLHGYDSPWPAGGGKNKASYVYYQSQTGQYDPLISGSYKLVSGKRYVISFDTPNTGVKVFRQSPESLGFSSLSQYGFTLDGNRKSLWGVASGDFTIENKSIIVKSATTETESGLCSNFMIEEVADGVTTPTSYAPYSNICPISGWSAVGIERTGKNLLDLSAFAAKATARRARLSVNQDNTLTVTCTESGQVWVGTAAGVGNSLLNDYTIPVNGGETIVLSTSFAVASFAVVEADAEKTVTRYNTTTGAVTLREDTRFVAARFVVSNSMTAGDSVTGTFQVERGSQPTAFKPFTGNTYTITLGQTVYGGTLDLATGVLTVDRASVDLGTLGWNKHRRNIFYSYNFTAKPVSASDVVSNLICSEYKTLSGDAVYSLNDGISMWSTSNNVAIYDSNKAGLTTNQFKTAMSGVQLVYELATPQTYQLTPTEVTTLLGQNNVWCDAGEISELKYYDGDITDTDIQTENGVLVTGDKLFYALSSPRTSSFTPTAVNAVQGENTMSANTGDIAVTYTTNWHDITTWIAWQGISFSRNDVDAPDAGRDMSGLMHRGRVAVKEKININTIPLTRAQSAELQTLLYPETYQVRITPYPRTNAQQVLSVYSNNVKTSYVIHRESGEDLQTVSFPMIEN